jgi:hypothetical protein
MYHGMLGDCKKQPNRSQLNSCNRVCENDQLGLLTAILASWHDHLSAPLVVPEVGVLVRLGTGPSAR